MSKPEAGHFAKAKVEAGDLIAEFRLEADDQPEEGEFEAGQELKVDLFEEGQKVDVVGTSIGKGFAGTVKRHNFRTQDATHGNSLAHRAPGSIGQNQTPGRVFKGKKMSGHMGNVRRTAQNLEVVRVDAERNLFADQGRRSGPQRRSSRRPAFCESGSIVMKLKMAGSGTVDVADSAFGAEFNEALVHQVVTAFLAGGRAGTKAQKNRAAVRGGGAKPWRQKGTGRARAGTIRSPIWVGGGRAFAAKPRDYSQKVNKKMYRAALRSVVSELVRQDRLVVTDSIEMKAPKTKELAGMLKKLDLDNVLIVNEAFDEKVFLSARNLPNVGICDAAAIDPVVLMRFEKVLITVPALKMIEERLS